MGRRSEGRALKVVGGGVTRSVRSRGVPGGGRYPFTPTRGWDGLTPYTDSTSGRRAGTDVQGRVSPPEVGVRVSGGSFHDSPTTPAEPPGPTGPRVPPTSDGPWRGRCPPSGPTGPRRGRGRGHSERHEAGRRVGAGGGGPSTGTRGPGRTPHPLACLERPTCPDPRLSRQTTGLLRVRGGRPGGR